MQTEPRTMTLLDVRRGRSGSILSLPDDPNVRSQCIRLGIAVGAGFTCLERLPGGTVVLETRRQEIAVGRTLAASICIELQ